MGSADFAVAAVRPPRGSDLTAGHSGGPGHPIVVVGGGLAGLTAAKTLVDSGVAVTVLEEREVLGGKVSAWRDDDGDWIESGLHVFFGAYEEIYPLMKELGVYDEILWKDHVLQYTLSGGERFAFRAAALPSPLHLAPAITENRYFSWRDKIRLAKSITPMLFGGDGYLTRQDALSYAEWHLRFGVGERLLTKMFVPMSLALKFVPPPEISAKVVLDVMGMFLKRPGASRMGFLSGSPAEKLIGPLADWVRRRGGTIRTRTRVAELIPSERARAVAGVRLENGEIIPAAGVILAVPVHRLTRLVRREWRGESYFDNLTHFEGVPVMSVQLWLDRQVTGIDNVLFGPDGRIPVYADMGNTTPDYRNGGNSRLHFCVAPARDLMEMSDEEVYARVWSDFADCFPRTAPGARIVKRSIVRIPKSVYWPKPGIDCLRPTQRSPIDGLFLAGGVTRQRFYDSMEGAVQSGRLAAAALLEARPWVRG